MWAAIGVGLSFLGVVSMLAAASTFFGSVGVAAQARRDAGTTPAWLEPMWSAANWSEAVYIVVTGVAYVVFGIGMFRAGLPAAWTAWASVAVGARFGSGDDCIASPLRLPSATPGGPDRAGFCRDHGLTPNKLGARRLLFALRQI